MRIRAYDSFQHEHDTRLALGQDTRPDPDAIRSALDETETALGYIVGRHARLPAGDHRAVRPHRPGGRHVLRGGGRPGPERWSALGATPSGSPSTRCSSSASPAGASKGRGLIGSPCTSPVTTASGRQLVANLSFTI
ncbi:MAG: hypothetical protein R2746_07035 [Acidimicrobiales bacterium]